MKPGSFGSVIGSVALAGTALLAAGAPSAGAATVTQTYRCSSSLGSLSTSVKFSGTATLATKTIKLSNVKVTVSNTTTTTASIDKVSINVPDPNKTSAPYKSGSVKVGSTPAGWTAARTTQGIAARHAGTITFKAGATLTNAPLSAAYTDKGPKGTVISFHPGVVSFTLTSPISTAVTCTPTSPKKTIASVTE